MFETNISNINSAVKTMSKRTMFDQKCPTQVMLRQQCLSILRRKDQAEAKSVRH